MLKWLEMADQIDPDEYEQMFPEEAEFVAWVRSMEEKDINVINELAAHAAALDRAEEMVD